MSDFPPRSPDRFQQLLDRWADSPPGERAAVADSIREEFEETVAIFVLDMSGFSASVASDARMPSRYERL